jgi:DNA-binding transcriptional LysR family regulator
MRAQSHMLSWDDFRYVKAIAESRSLAGAAERLGINHSTVFRRLGQIEQHLGSRLFERGRGGYALTASGEQMVELANRLGEDIVTFERRVTGQDLRPSGELRVTTTDIILLRLLQDVLVGFRRAYPKIVLDLIVTSKPLNLSKRDADIALRATYPGADVQTGTRLTSIAWAIYGPIRLASRSFDPMTDGRRHDWIAFADNTSIAKAMKWLKEHVPEDRIVYKVNTLVGLAEAAAAGIGLALMPCFVGAGVPGLARLTPAIPEVAGELWLLTHPDLQNSVRVRAFMDFCAAEIGRREKMIECRPDD